MTPEQLARPGEIPADLVDFASRQAGEFAQRFDAIIDYAWRNHVLILNAKQLRELAGGGAQATAQQAITRLRQRLHQSMGQKLPLIQELPEEIVDLATQVVRSLWGEAVIRAGSELRAHVAASQAREQDLQTQLDQAKDAANAYQQCIEDMKRDADLLVRESESLATRLKAGKAAAEQVAAQLRAELDQVSLARSEMSRIVIELESRLASAMNQLQEFRSEAAARFDRVLVEHREACNTLVRGHREELDRLTAASKEVQAELSMSKAEVFELMRKLAHAEVGRDHAQQAAHGHEQRCHDLERRLLQMGEQLAEARARAPESPARPGGTDKGRKRSRSLVANNRDNKET